jgi:hypothetical protein
MITESTTHPHYAMTRWKVTLIVDIDPDSHPRKFIPEAVNMELNEGEDLVDYEMVEVEPDFDLDDYNQGDEL